MPLTQNELVQVQTYTDAMLDHMEDLYCLITSANHTYDKLEKIPNQLGSTVLIRKPIRMTAADGLVPVFQGINQRIEPLTLDFAKNSAYTFTMPQIVFNIGEYPSEWMDEFGESAAIALGGQAESFVANQFEQQTFRYFGDGVSSLSTINQLSAYMAQFREFGSAGKLQVYLANTDVPSIVGSALGQFALKRNEMMARDWEIGSYDNATIYRSNLLTTHISGSVGNSFQTLTVVSTNDPTGQNITQVKFSGANLSDGNAVKQNDVFTFQQNSLTFATFATYIPCAAPVQFRATADASSDGSGNVIVNIYPALSISPQVDERITITQNIVAGMTVKSVPSHRCGAMVSGRGLFAAIADLPNTSPFDYALSKDPKTGVTIRSYYGHIIELGTQGLVHDMLMGSTLVPENSARIIVPLGY